VLTIISGQWEKASDLEQLASIAGNEDSELTWREVLIANVLYCHPTTTNVQLKQRLHSCNSLMHNTADERHRFEQILGNVISFQTDKVRAVENSRSCKPEGGSLTRSLAGMDDPS